MTDDLALRIEHERQEAAAARDHLYGLLCEALDTMEGLFEYLPVGVADEAQVTLDRLRVSGGIPA